MEKIKTIIRPSTGFSLQLKDLWHHRELLYFFTWRDIKVRYKQTFLGIAWAVLQPLGLMLLFVFVFSRSSLSQSVGKDNYPVFVLTGLVLWNLFYASVSHAAESMISNAGIIRKIYFPRLVIPMAALFTAMVDFVIGLLLLVVCCIVFGQQIYWVGILPALGGVIILLLTAFGIGTFLSALNVKYRDFRYALPFLLQFLFFATGIIYSTSLIEGSSLHTLFALNPLNASVELFRSLLGYSVNNQLVLTGTITSILLAAVGFYYFRKTENYFADIV